MEIRCPKCEQAVEPRNINEAAGFFVCGECDEAYRICEVVENKQGQTFDIERPPQGVYFKKTDNGFAIYASCRSIGCAVFFLAFTALFVSFLVYALYSITHGGDIISYLTAILSPVLALLCLYGVLIYTRGRVIITVEGDRGTLFRGIGRRGKTEHFRWSGVTDVRHELKGEGRSAQRFFIIDGDPGVIFTPELDMERIDYIKFALRAMIRGRDSGRGGGEND